MPCNVGTNWPDVVEALGSIAAIVLTGGLFFGQRWLERRDKKEEDKLRVIALAAALAPDVIDVQARMRRMVQDKEHYEKRPEELQRIYSIPEQDALENHAADFYRLGADGVLHGMKLLAAVRDVNAILDDWHQTEPKFRGSITFVRPQDRVAATASAQRVIIQANLFLRILRDLLPKDLAFEVPVQPIQDSVSG